MERTILHSDANCFYASVEMLYHPEYVGKPLAVGGDSEARHGIVLTANYIAKRSGVKTGMALWKAKQYPARKATSIFPNIRTPGAP